jgi:hypothetical protein
VASVLRVGRKDGIKGGCKVLSGPGVSIFFLCWIVNVASVLVHFRCRFLSFGRLVGSAAGHFRDFFFFFHRFGSVSKSERSRGQHLGVTSESLRFAFPFFCLVVAFRESEEYLVRRGRKLYFRTSCRQG